MENILIQEQALERFRVEFPLTRVIADDEALRYTLPVCSDEHFYEALANRLIMKHRLPLEANILRWSSNRRGVFEMVLEIKMVPEPHSIPCY